MLHSPATDVTGELSIQLLGDFRVSVCGHTISHSAWHSHKGQSLLKMLALAPEHRLHREYAMEALWPDQEPEAAANNLHKALHAARRVLEPSLLPNTASSYLHLRGQSILLEPAGSLWIDVKAFQVKAAAARITQDPGVYEDALRLYAGDLLPEDFYEDWANAHREHLKTTRFELLMGLAALREQRDETAAAIETLRQVIAGDPVYEDAHCRLMRLLVRTGQRHLALRQYQALCDAMQRELDAEPEASTHALYRRILNGDFSPNAQSSHLHALPSPATANTIYRLVFPPYSDWSQHLQEATQ